MKREPAWRKAWLWPACLAMLLSIVVPGGVPARSQDRQPGQSPETGTRASAPGISANDQQPGSSQDAGTGMPAPASSASGQRPDQQLAGSVGGTVLDGSGAPVIGARIRLTPTGVTQDLGNRGKSQETLSDADGAFFFGGVTPGNFQLAVESEGFATKLLSGTLHSGEMDTLPPILLMLAGGNTSVQVVAPQSEIAEDEIKAQEKQRLLGVIPNFYVSYIPNAAPLDARQKFELAWKATIDPVTFALTGALAGLEQADNGFSGYGQGAQGYGKRFGAAYADTVTGTFLGGAILPTLLRQDPRYFYKGTGSVRSRILYAIAMSVIAKGDNQRWQPNYSGVVGSLVAGAISNLYYPASNQSDVAVMFENTGIGIGETAVTNILQEFVVRKLTPSLRHNNPGGNNTGDPARP